MRYEISYMDRDGETHSTVIVASDPGAAKDYLARTNPPEPYLGIEHILGVSELGPEQ